MSSRLTEVLSRWGGRRQMQAAFEARGFHLHRTWQEERIKACGADQRDGVEHYWDEYALEVVRSAGHVTPETRAWRIPPPYRSPYLDELYRRVDYLRPPYVRVPLIKCLFEYLNWNRQPGVGRREFARFQGLKHGEIGHLAAPDELWTGRKRDVPKIVESIAVGHGFARRGGRLLRSHSSNLTFEIGFDLGGQAYVVGLPIVCSIFDDDDRRLIYKPIHFDHIIPGFYYYELSDEPRAWIWSIMAYVGVFCSLYDSIHGPE